MSYPLVQSPQTFKKTLKKPRYRKNADKRFLVEANIKATVCPNHEIRYECEWISRPPEGNIAIVRGHLQFTENGTLDPRKTKKFECSSDYPTNSVSIINDAGIRQPYEKIAKHRIKDKDGVRFTSTEIWLVT